MALKTKPKVRGKVKVDTFKTALEVLKDKNLSGKVVVITGANSGIGMVGNIKIRQTIFVSIVYVNCM